MLTHYIKEDSHMEMILVMQYALSLALVAAAAVALSAAKRQLFRFSAHLSKNALLRREQ